MRLIGPDDQLGQGSGPAGRPTRELMHFAAFSPRGKRAVKQHDPATVVDEIRQFRSLAWMQRVVARRQQHLAVLQMKVLCVARYLEIEVVGCLEGPQQGPSHVPVVMAAAGPQDPPGEAAGHGTTKPLYGARDSRCERNL